MPMAPSYEIDHYFIVTIVGGTMWFAGYCGIINCEDFAYGCQCHANGGIVTMPGASKLCYAFKCTAADQSLLVHVVVVVGCRVYSVSLKLADPRLMLLLMLDFHVWGTHVGGRIRRHKFIKLTVYVFIQTLYKLSELHQVPSDLSHYEEVQCLQVREVLF